MPHVSVKMYPGRDEAMKDELAKAIIEAVTRVTHCSEQYVSVTIEDVDREQWPETIYRPDILDKDDVLYKKPGYNPFE